MHQLQSVSHRNFPEDDSLVEEVYVESIGATSTVALPYEYIEIRCEAKFPNINDTGCFIVPFVSQTKVIVFSAFFVYRTREWGVKVINEDSVKWLNFEEFIKKPADVLKSINSVFDKYAEFTLIPIKKHFDLLEDLDEEIASDSI